MSFGIVYCFIVLYVLWLAIHDISRTTVAQYSLFVLKVPVNTYQPTNAHRKLYYNHGDQCTDRAPFGLRGCKNRPAPFPGRML